MLRVLSINFLQMKTWPILAMAFIMHFSLSGQSNILLDSNLAYLQTVTNDSLRVKTLLQIAKIYSNTNPDSALYFLNKCESLSKSPANKKYYIEALLLKANILTETNQFEKSEIVLNELLKIISNDAAQKKYERYVYNEYISYGRKTGNYKLALDYAFKLVKIAQTEKDEKLECSTLGNIAGIFFDMNDLQKSLYYDQQTLALIVKNKDWKNYSLVNFNIGSVLGEMGEHDSALYYYNIADSVALALNDKQMQAEINSNIAFEYFDAGDDANAKIFFDKAIKLYDELQIKDDSYAMLNCNLGQLYMRQNDLAKAEQYLLRADELGNTSGFLSDKVEYKKQLALLYSKLKIWDKAFIYNQQLMQLKDSLAKDENLRISHDLENKYNVAQKEKQILILNKDKQLQQKEIQRQRVLQYATLIIAAIFLLFGSLFLFQRIRIAKEKRKSDSLLLNILPKQTAEELKASGKTEAKYYESCSILFTDFENFTTASELLSPQQLVSEIDMCYSAFDKILLKYNIEKIKTIGDSYMCVAGLPAPNKNHAADILNAALEIRNFMNDLYEERKRKNEMCFKIRIGINTGPLVAGVVGSSKFAYDVWGDAVNIASRMESSSETGKVNISGSTYELVKDNFTCTYRGKIAVKNKGEIDMYFAEKLP